jgi:uridine kinase
MTININDQDQFSQILYQYLQVINPAIMDLELFEFRYALENLIPKFGWEGVEINEPQEIEVMLDTCDYYESIQLRPRINGKPVMDEQIVHLTQMLFKGLVIGKYSPDWIDQHFFFDLRGFYFFHRTAYYNHMNKSWLGSAPYKSFEQKQRKFIHLQAVGYQVFKQANQEVDQCFIDLLKNLIQQGNQPLLIGIAGQTAAGKTEIVARIQQEFTKQELSFTSLEIDHFLTDRDLREEQGIDSLGKEALHFDLFIHTLKELRQGKKISIPQYDFISATSSHTLEGELKPGCSTGVVVPADLIFIEGNFPFLYPEVAELIDLKVVYLTDDEIRLKRKWKRDIDYRKKYEQTYFLNRYFREQFLMAEAAYIPQMGKCDILVDTTKAEIWLKPAIKKLIQADNCMN